MIIEQTLHGYNKGHGLLASSFPVKPNDDSSLMSVLSDWTGYRDELGGDSYMTFYPLSNGEKYAFAKTWYAEEMERPGCVWTHTLIVDLKKVDRNFDFRTLENYFRRPLKDKYDFYHQKIEIDTFENGNSNAVFEQFDDTSLMVLYLLLLGNNKNLFIYMDKDHGIYDALCFYLLQYMPLDMLKNIELSTGSVSNRKIGDIDFSIQFTDNTANISLSNAPWNGKFDKTNFYVGLQYIFEQSKTLNDPFPSLIRLFREDIREDKDKLMAFAVLMKKLDTALTENVGAEQYAEVLHLLEESFPNIYDGVRLKCNFLSKKISSLYGTEKDYLYQIASLKNDSFLYPEETQFESRLMELDKENHAGYIDLITKIAALAHPNDTACKALLYAINNMEEQELLNLIDKEWEKLLPFLSSNDRFFESGMWLKVSNDKFNTIFLLFSQKLSDKFIYWDGLLNKAIDAEALVGEDVSKKIIEKAKDAVSIIFEAANSGSHHFVSPFLLQACLLKKQDIFIWMNSQETINERVEQFLLYKIEPNDYDLKSNSSSVWKAFLNQDNENKNIDFYIYLYILAHNWHDVIAIEMLKHSFYHIYIALSKNQLDEKYWNRISCFTSISYFIDKWDKCKILSRGLVDYLKNTSVDIRVLKEFTPNKKINERLVHYWKKS
ncbi:hypothetical protein DW657_01930 [Prevotella sp. AM23-5]|uniref:GAP1-N1 domain-containing protein n=1 Tax=Prevotellaceae TaxID=171552 RepID=UPI000E518379|nr:MULTISPECIES: hypothetical protein [Prevotellaceae]RHN98178.1 hypothetical protein DW657_01930 [Prevotella sp. AM23-5]